jgi:hypothetical protein
MKYLNKKVHCLMQKTSSVTNKAKHISTLFTSGAQHFLATEFHWNSNILIKHCK